MDRLATREEWQILTVELDPKNFNHGRPGHDVGSLEECSLEPSYPAYPALRQKERKKKRKREKK